MCQIILVEILASEFYPENLNYDGSMPKISITMKREESSQKTIPLLKQSHK